MRDEADTPPVVTEVRAVRAAPGAADAGPPAKGGGEALAWSNEWTCPMYPEVVRSAPGNCRVCGMALEPCILTRNGAEGHEPRKMTRRFWVSAALAGPAFKDLWWMQWKDVAPATAR